MSMTRELALCHIAALKQQPEQSGAYLGSSEAERLTVNQVVAGSIPALDANTIGGYMASIAATRRRKKARTQGQDAPQATTTPETQTSAPAANTASAVRPTAERMTQGKWASPQGHDKRSQPMVDLASDMIGRLYQHGHLSTAQEQAARTFQELWAAYRSEIGAAEFRSCLAGGVGAHDDGDGNPAVYAAWYGLCDKIGRQAVAAIKMNVERNAGEKVLKLDALKLALDRVAGVDTSR